MEKFFVVKITLNSKSRDIRCGGILKATFKLVCIACCERYKRNLKWVQRDGGIEIKMRKA